MIIEFKVTNFRSFKQQQTLSLVAEAASKDSILRDNLIDCGDFKLVKAAAIFGANASGKSNIIRALQFVDRFVNTSATRMNLGDSIEGVTPFMLDAETSDSPSSFELNLLIEGTQYVYGFSATCQRVFDEWLRARPKGGKMTTWLSRRSGPNGPVWETKGPLKKDEALLREKTRDNGLALSRGAELNIPALSELFLWLRNDLFIYDWSFPPMHLVEKTAAHVRDDPTFASRILKLVKSADLGIDSLSVAEEPAFTIPTGAPETVINVLNAIKKVVDEKDLKQHRVTTFHRVADTDKPIAFKLIEDESNGTQRFFALAGPLLDALDNGHTLVIDEFDCSMHPLLSRRLVKLFQSPTANKKGAQLIFATHDGSLMSQTLLRRDQIWLTEKNQCGATQLFSLYDFADRPRGTSAFERNYFYGKYGAIPRFGPVFEDMEID